MQYNKNRINYKGEFKDKLLEKQYEVFEFNNIIKSVKPNIFYLVLLYLSFLIPEYILLKDKEQFYYYIIIRLFFVVSISIFSSNIAKIQNYNTYSIIISIYEIILSSVILLFLHVINLSIITYASNYFILILLVNFLPNRWKYTFGINFSIFIYLGYRIYMLSDLSYEVRIGIIINILLITLIISTFCYCINLRKRKDFEVNRTIHDLSKKDPLTGLCNRAKFDNELLYYLGNQNIHPFGIIMFDIDNFKSINDTYGHLVGDSVLIEISDLISEIVRKDDIYARWGGEEFVILTYNESIDSCFKLVKRVKKVIVQHTFNKVGKVTCSYGVTISNGIDDQNSIIERVDQLLYEAKNAGKNKIVCG